MLASLNPIWLLKLIFRASETWKNSYIWDFSKSILYLTSKCKYSTNNKSNCSRAVFLKRFYVFFPKQGHFWSFHALFKKQEVVGKFPDQESPNILRFFTFSCCYLLPQKKQLDYYHIAYDLWNWGNFRKMSKLSAGICSVSLPMKKLGKM